MRKQTISKAMHTYIEDINADMSDCIEKVIFTLIRRQRNQTVLHFVIAPVYTMQTLPCGDDS